jgi:hypothetical protein
LAERKIAFVNDWPQNSSESMQPEFQSSKALCNQPAFQTGQREAPVRLLMFQKVSGRGMRHLRMLQRGLKLKRNLTASQLQWMANLHQEQWVRTSNRRRDHLQHLELAGQWFSIRVEAAMQSGQA